MLTKGDIIASIKELSGRVEGLSKLVEMQQYLIHGLRKDNRDMLNRLMVRNGMAEYAQTSPASVAEMDDMIPAVELARSDKFSEEHLAGTVVEE